MEPQETEQSVTSEPFELVTGPDIDASPPATDTFRPWAWAAVADLAAMAGMEEFAEEWIGHYDTPEDANMPILGVEGTPFDFSFGADDIVSTIGKLFGNDTMKQNDDFTYESMMAELETFTEADPSTGPLELTHAFATNDESVPEYAKFGPAATMTQIIMQDEAVAEARRGFLAGEGNLYSYQFRLDDFLRETAQLESPVQGGTDGIEVSDRTLTEHMLGSYAVRVAETPDGQLLFIVGNRTGLTSGTRIPLTDISLMEDRPRSEGMGGTIHQRYYWTEPKAPAGGQDAGK